MNYQVHITKTAEHDIAKAADYIEFVLKNPQAADHLLDVATEKNRRTDPDAGETTTGG